MKLGIIGLGNMATAMLGGIIGAGLVKAEDISGSDYSEAAGRAIEEKLGIHTGTDNLAAIKNAEIVILAVKPQVYDTVLNQIKGHVSAGQVVISIAPGKTLSYLEGYFGGDKKIVRLMPNTPALVGEGCTGVCKNGNVSDEEFKTVMALLNSFGKAYEVTENQMDAVVAISGSSPAYVFMLIEAMADGAVAEGLPRKTAYEMAAQAVLGSAKMVLETGRHPGDLKDMVCSPAGTTIEAVGVLEAEGFRGAVIDAVRTCADKSRNL